MTLTKIHRLILIQKLVKQLTSALLLLERQQESVQCLTFPGFKSTPSERKRARAAVEKSAARVEKLKAELTQRVNAL